MKNSEGAARKLESSYFNQDNYNNNEIQGMNYNNMNNQVNIELIRYMI